jgi:hypothetical protein
MAARGARAANVQEMEAAGFCGSCWRVQERRDIQTRPTGERYYADRCRWCGSFRSRRGEDPPLALLRIYHDRGRVTIAEETRICGPLTDSDKPAKRKRGWQRASRSTSGARVRGMFCRGHDGRSVGWWPAHGPIGGYGPAPMRRTRPLGHPSDRGGLLWAFYVML